MLTLPRTLSLTPDQFAEVCAANPEAVLELDALGHLVEMTPTGSAAGARNQTLGALLWLAIEQSRLPLKLLIVPPASCFQMAPYAAPTPVWCC
jgi:Uma2 family endonuclease